MIATLVQINLSGPRKLNPDRPACKPTMANYQLGPESPRPFSVISEGDIQRRVALPFIPEYERYNFGKSYESKMCELTHKHLELNTNDRMCYVGDPKGSLVPLLQDRFCLMEPVTSVIPGHIHYEESRNHRMLPIKVADVGAQDYFKRASQSKGAPFFDKILLKDAVRFMDDPRSTYFQIFSVLDELGRVVIIERPGAMNTLPVFENAKTRMSENEENYLKIIRDLQACKLNVQWEIECLPITMPKSKWYSMVSDRFPPQMDMVSNHEVVAGLRELSEGVMKYTGEEIEFYDRLLFITASKTIFSEMPQIQRYGIPPHKAEPIPQPTPMKYNMEVTSDIKPYVREIERRSRIKGIKH